MKKGLVVLGALSLLLVSCGSAPAQEVSTETTSSSEAVVQESESAAEMENSEDSGDEVSALRSEDGDIAGIIFMREEEKLARDVYLKMTELWGMNIFSNIAGSEQSHMDAVLNLIDMTGVDDPVQGREAGEFLNQDLQALYDNLVDRGRESLAEALLVGAAIEEIDILDLQEYLAETDDPNISEVYQNLLKGSINHLQSFVRTYERQTGEQYQPQYLTEEAYQELLSVSPSRGGGGGQSRSAK